MIHPIFLTKDRDMMLACPQSECIVASLLIQMTNIGTERIKKDSIDSKKLYVESFPVT